MSVRIRFLSGAILLCSALTANAGLIQKIKLINGIDPTATPFETVLVEFPQQAGCISGVGYFLPAFTCEGDLGVPETNVPADVVISGTLGDGSFNAGAWIIDDDWLLERSAWSFEAGGYEIAIFGTMPFPVTSPFPPDNPVSVIGAWQRRLVGTTDESIGLALVTPVPVPPTLILFTVGLFVLRMVRFRLD